MDKELLVLEEIKRNPFISQQELADKVHLSRSAVANYISQLVKKGEIKGRAYVLREEKHITCIGGANIDRKAITKDEIRFHSSNPVAMKQSHGGVARNVAENLSRLDNKVSLLTAVGNDHEGANIMEVTTKKGIDMSLSTILSHERTGTYTALLNPEGEMVVSLADMDIYDTITPEVIEEKWSHLVASGAIFADTNIPAETLAYLMKRCKEEKIPLYIDPVSSTKAKKLPADLSGIQVLFPNMEEAEEIAGIHIHDPSDYKMVVDKIRSLGARNVVMTLGAGGLYYATETSEGHLPSLRTNVVDVTGAGDALTAGTISALVHGADFISACYHGMAAAALTVQTTESTYQSLSPKNIQKLLKEHN